MAPPTSPAPPRLGDDRGGPGIAAGPSIDPNDPGAGLLELAEAIEQRHAARTARSAGPSTAPPPAAGPLAAPVEPRLAPPPPRPRARRGLLVLAAAGVAVLALAVLTWRAVGGDDDPAGERLEAVDTAPATRAPSGTTAGDAPTGEASDAAPPAAEARDDEGEPGAADEAEGTDATELDGDDEQGAAPDGELAPGAGPVDDEAVPGGAECSAAALLAAVDGTVDGRPVEVVDHECDGDFALVRFRVTDADPGAPLDVWVTFYRGEGPWDDRYTSRSLDCAAIAGQVLGFPLALCDAVP